MSKDLTKYTQDKRATQDQQELEGVKNSVVKRIKTVDKLSKIIENTLDEAELLGSPLSLAPGTAGYEDTIELYIKLIKANKDLVESFRKLKMTEFTLRDRENKIELRNAFVKAIEGKSLEEIKKLVRAGNFAPVNVVAGTLFGSAVVDGDSNAARTIMGGMSDWGSNEEFSDASPQLMVNLNLNDKAKKDFEDSGGRIEEVEDVIDVEVKEVKDE